MALTILDDCDGIGFAIEWVEMFDLSMPVHCDADGVLWDTFNPDVTIPARPQAVVVDRDMTILLNEWEMDAADLAEEAVLGALD